VRSSTDSEDRWSRIRLLMVGKCLGRLRRLDRLRTARPIELFALLSLRGAYRPRRLHPNPPNSRTSTTMMMMIHSMYVLYPSLKF
jgi:hypothetical protein